MPCLIVSNGYYTTIVAFAALKQMGLSQDNNYIFGYYKQIKNDYATHVNLTKKAFNVVDILNYQKYLSGKNFNSQLWVKDTKNLAFNYILIPINSTTKKWHYLFKGLYPNAKFIFYEEGMLSYLKPIMDFKLRSLLKNNLCFFNNFNQSLLTLVKNNLPQTSYLNIIDLNNFKSAAQQLKKQWTGNFAGLNLNNSSNFLFMPQYYYESDPYQNQKKLTSYLNITQKLLAKGYTVLVKEHPKTNYTVFEFLQNHLQSNQLINLSSIQSLPVELFLPNLNLKGIFSVYSTSLLSGSSALYNIPCFSSYPMLNNRINTMSLYPGLSCYLTKLMFPDIENFLNYYHTNSRKYYNYFVQHNYINLESLENLNFWKLLLVFLFKD